MNLLHIHDPIPLAFSPTGEFGHIFSSDILEGSLEFKAKDMKNLGMKEKGDGKREDAQDSFITKYAEY